LPPILYPGQVTHALREPTLAFATISMQHGHAIDRIEVHGTAISSTRASGIGPGSTNSTRGA